MTDNTKLTVTLTVQDPILVKLMLKMVQDPIRRRLHILRAANAIKVAFEHASIDDALQHLDTVDAEEDDEDVQRVCGEAAA